jgi:hypothetical protein
MQEELEALKARALQMELAVSGAIARDAMSGDFADALQALASDLADRATALATNDASEEGHPIAA